MYEPDKMVEVRLAEDPENVTSLPESDAFPRINEQTAFFANPSADDINDFVSWNGKALEEKNV